MRKVLMLMFALCVITTNTAASEELVYRNGGMEVCVKDEGIEICQGIRPDESKLITVDDDGNNLVYYPHSEQVCLEDSVADFRVCYPTR